jgi:hypothetical protein
MHVAVARLKDGLGMTTTAIHVSCASRHSVSNLDCQQFSVLTFQDGTELDI